MKQPKQIPKRMRQALHERAEGRCEICNGPADNAHHRKNRSVGGRHELSNLMLLCGSGTVGCHGMVTRSPYYAESMGWRVPSYKHPAGVPVRRYRGSKASVQLGDDGSLHFIEPGVRGA